MSDLEIEKIIDINDDLLEVRLEMIKKQLSDLSKSLRGDIDENKNTEELVSDNNFKKWVICNEIYNTVSQNEEFSKIVYYMYTECNNDIEKFISFYDIEYIFDDNKNISGINLITLE